MLNVILNCRSLVAEIKGISLSEMQDKYSIPLEYDSFKEFYFSNQLYWEDEEFFQSEDELFLVSNPSYISGMSDLKDAEKEINENTMINIKSDVYINESYQIINDLITLTK